MFLFLEGLLPNIDFERASFWQSGFFGKLDWIIEVKSGAVT